MDKSEFGSRVIPFRSRTVSTVTPLFINVVSLATVRESRTTYTSRQERIEALNKEFPQYRFIAEEDLPKPEC